MAGIGAKIPQMWRMQRYLKLNHMQQMESMRHIRVRPLWGLRRLRNRRYIYVRRFLKFKGISTNPEISKARASRGTTAKTLQRRDGVTQTPLHTTNGPISVSFRSSSGPRCNVKSLLRSTNSFVIGVSFIVSSLSSSWTGEGPSVNGATMSSLPKERRPSRCIKEKSGTSFSSLRKAWMRHWYRRRSQIRLISR